MDIFNLLKSKARKKILRFFFKNTDKKYYLRELERILHLPVGNVRRELVSLEKINLFKREKMGNQIYYSLNHKSPYFKGVENIIAKASQPNFRATLKADEPVVIERDDLNSLISRIKELENTLNNILLNMPKGIYNYRTSTKKSKRRMVSY